MEKCLERGEWKFFFKFVFYFYVYWGNIEEAVKITRKGSGWDLEIGHDYTILLLFDSKNGFFRILERDRV